MMAAQTIRADGIEWPLATFLDAYRMLQVDPRGDPPALDGQARVCVVTRDGELTPPIYADRVRWFDVIAFRPIDCSPEANACRVCGEPSLRVGEEDICRRCEDAAEPWW